MSEDKAHHQSVLHREPTCSHLAASKNLHIKISSHLFHRGEMIFGVGQSPFTLAMSLKVRKVSESYSVRMERAIISIWER